MLFLFSDKRNDLLDNVDCLSTLHMNMTPIDIPVPVSLELLMSVAVEKCDGDIRSPLYTGMDVLSDGRLVVVDKSNGKLYVLDENLQRLRMYRLFGRRLDVAVVSEEEVAVTGGPYRFIEFLHISKNNYISLTRMIPTTAQYNCICLMNDSRFLVNTINDSRPMRMITFNGTEKDLDTLPEKPYRLNDSGSTYMRDTDITVLTDRLDNTVYMYYNKEGRHALKYTVRDDHIKEPIGACQGPNHSVFVCSLDTHSIVQVSASGRVLGSHTLDMQFPRTVCMSKDGQKVAVANGTLGNMKLQLFRVSDK